jgi:hypothetical protein
MPTLANINGASLVGGDASNLLNALNVFGQDLEAEEAKKTQATAQAAQQKEIDILTGASPSADPEREAAFGQIGEIAPDLVGQIQGALDSGDPEAVAQIGTAVSEGKEKADRLLSLGSHAEKLNVLREDLQKGIADGTSSEEDIARVIALSNMPEDQLNLELQKMQIVGTAAGKVIPKPEGLFGTPEKRAAFTRLSAVNPKLAEQLRKNEETRREGVTSGAGGLASAKTEFLPGGGSLQALPGGEVVAKDEQGRVATGQKRQELLNRSKEFQLSLAQGKADIGVSAERQKAQAKAGVEIETGPTIAGGREAGKQAVQQSVKAFERLEAINTNIANIDEAIGLIDQGAETGVIASKLPSFRASSIQLDTLQKRLGLDVIAGTTFGALSEGEREFALSTALPKNLSPPDLRRWLVRKKDNQAKLSAELSEAAAFLGTPGNTITDFIELKRLDRLDRESGQAGSSAGQQQDISSMSDQELERLALELGAQ